jgi:large conductance mechanosensitive channel
MVSLTEGATTMGSSARGFAREFREFLLKQNVIALAIGVVIGAAIGKVVSGVVDDVIMPLVGLVLPAGDWRQAKLALGGGNAILYGDLLGRLLDFGIVALVVFLILRALVKQPKAAPAAATKACPFCLETIPAAASRCRACGSTV